MYLCILYLHILHSRYTRSLMLLYDFCRVVLVVVSLACLNPLAHTSSQNEKSSNTLEIVYKKSLWFIFYFSFMHMDIFWLTVSLCGRTTLLCGNIFSRVNAWYFFYSNTQNIRKQHKPPQISKLYLKDWFKKKKKKIQENLIICRRRRWK